MDSKNMKGTTGESFQGTFESTPFKIGTTSSVP